MTAYPDFLRRACFTLVEMLIVIAIIGILAAMLMPTLHNAVAQAREAYCSNNQRQLVLAVHMYSADNASNMPALSGYGKGVQEGSYSRIYPYVANREYDSSSYSALQPYSDPRSSSVYICPANRQPWASRTWLQGSDAYYGVPKFSDIRIARSYSLNASLLPYRDISATNPERWSNYVSSGGTIISNGGPLPLSRIASPAKALMSLDWWPDYTSNANFTSSTISTYKASYNVGIDTFKVHVHGEYGGVIVGFADGHTGWMVGTVDEHVPSDALKAAASAANVRGGQ